MFSPEPVTGLMSDSRRRGMIIALVILMVVTALSFWLGSRYPALSEKALSGADTSLDAIGFDILLRADATASLFERIFVTSVNWLYTNWRGMVFGLVFGTLLMSLLSIIRDMQFKNRYLNALTGLLIGAPLGVCANCAAPIAQGMLMAGSRQETALAALLSSPTLNVVVLSMALALLPFHLVVLKITFSLVAILLLVPIICRIAPISVVAPLPKARVEIVEPELQAGQQTLLMCLISLIIKTAWRLSLRTVPLMILAGFMGGIAVTVLPLDQLSSVLPAVGGKKFLLALPLLALFGLFLPVPIAFDIIVTAILLQAGLHPAYAAVLLLTLGIFSIYPFTLLRASGAGKAAMWLSAGLITMAVIGGFIASIHNKFLEAEQQNIKRNLVAAQARPLPRADSSIRKPGFSDNEIAQLTKGKDRSWQTVRSNDLLQIERLPFIANNQSGNKDSAISFDILDGRKFGIEEPLNFLPFKLGLRMAEFRGIAAGDVNGDSWPDIVFASHDGIGLYINDAGQRFIPQIVNIGLPKDSYIGSVALIDINNNGALDLVLSTLEDGAYIAENQGGRFTSEATSRLPNTQAKTVANVMAFADFDRNGEIDIFLGNVGRHLSHGQTAHAEAQNMLLMQQNGTLTGQLLDEIPAETLSVLATDFTGDDGIDIFVGNDFEPSDEIYVQDAENSFRKTGRSGSVVPYGGHTTMSITSADIDNDLIPELYLGQKNMDNAIHNISIQELCSPLENVDERVECQRFHELKAQNVTSVKERDFRFCDTLEDKSWRLGCYALLTKRLAILKADLKDCDALAKGWPIIMRECEASFHPLAKRSNKELADQIAIKRNRNILYKRNADNNYVDAADRFGLTDTGWTWNSKFADLDNDGWQDLFVVTGEAVVSNYHPFFLYRNNAGRGFTNVTKSAGFSSLRAFLGYSYIDLDADGDLDIIAIPSLGNPQIYMNQSPQAQAIQFQLLDQIGNRDGIGSRITIEYDGGHQMRDILASGGYLSFDPLIAHFGLDKISHVNRVTVKWSTGETQMIDGPFPAGFTYRIKRKD